LQYGVAVADERRGKCGEDVVDREDEHWVVIAGGGSTGNSGAASLAAWGPCIWRKMEALSLDSARNPRQGPRR
jgi:hypothetical protein